MNSQVSRQRVRPIGRDAAHVCVDVQRLFAEDTAWHTASIPAIVPNIARLAGHCPERTIFTRFRPPPEPAAAPGNWRRYYERWEELTTNRLGEAMIGLVAELARFVPPARTVDKTTYSAFECREFCAVLDELGCTAIVCTGVETDVCVLATVMQAMDRGHRVIVADDAVHGSTPAAHRATLDHVLRRFEDQIEIGTTAEIIGQWVQP